MAARSSLFSFTATQRISVVDAVLLYSDTACVVPDLVRKSRVQGLSSTAPVESAARITLQLPPRRVVEPLTRHHRAPNLVHMTLTCKKAVSPHHHHGEYHHHRHLAVTGPAAPPLAFLVRCCHTNMAVYVLGSDRFLTLSEDALL